MGCLRILTAGELEGNRLIVVSPGLSDGAISRQAQLACALLPSVRANPWVTTCEAVRGVVGKPTAEAPVALI